MGQRGGGEFLRQFGTISEKALDLGGLLAPVPAGFSPAGSAETGARFTRDATTRSQLRFTSGLAIVCFETPQHRRAVRE
jgi:hypothetical protein